MSAIPFCMYNIFDTIIRKKDDDVVLNVSDLNDIVDYQRLF